jgi:lauroyl/myristoyl acyltransferase
MRLNIFEESKQELKAKLDQRFNTDSLQTYQFLSANLSKCIPSIPTDQHRDAWFDIMAFKTLQHIDTEFSSRFTGIEDFNEFNYDEIRKLLPAVFVSFHIGSYKSAVAFLVKYNINVVLMVDPTTYKLGKEKFVEAFQRVKTAFNSTSELELYPADRQDLVIQIMGKMKQGYSVVAFIDGNSGGNGYLDRENSLKVPFFGQEIYVRTGLPTLSFYLKRPIIPMLSYYDDELNARWKVYEAIAPPKGERDPAAYVDQCTRYLYGIFEEALNKYPMQWEGWMFLHRYLNTAPFDALYPAVGGPADASAAAINDNIGLFVLDGKYYVLNKENYKLMELEPDMFQILKESNTAAIKERPADELQPLFKNRFLINN